MSILNKKHILKHIIMAVLVIVVLPLLLQPLNLPARTLVIIQHNNNAQQSADTRSLIESRDISAAKRRVDSARQNVERARQDVANAYIPRSEFQSSSRNYNILQAESALDRAQIEYRAAESDLYLLQRLHESGERERALESKRKPHRPIPRMSEPPYQQYDRDD